MTRDELLRKWVEALEGGEYEQTRRGLRDDRGYCCLGVACDKSGMGTWDRDTSRAFAYIAADRDRRAGFLPTTVRDALGLTLNQETTLAEANDNGESFHQIAQRIRAMFPDVFTESVV